MQMINNMPDETLVGDIKDPPQNDTSDHTIFKILVLKDRGKLSDISESVKELTSRRGDFSILQNEFLSRHNSSDINELKSSIERGYFLENNVRKVKHQSGASDDVITKENINQAGHHLKQIGKYITEWLLISIALVSGFVLSSLAGGSNYQWLEIASIIYGIYQLVFIVRISSGLKKAGESLINHK